MTLPPVAPDEPTVPIAPPEAVVDAMTDVVAVILAAGEGARFDGSTKQVADVGGLPLVARAVATANAAGVGRVVVVVGHDADAVARAAALGGACEVVANPDHWRGQATSLRAGIRHVVADPDAATIVVLLADQPGVTPEAVRAVAVAAGDGPVAARASYRDGPGHPVAFARPSWEKLTDLQGDVGARDLLGALDVAHVLVSGDVPRDVDTMEDLAAIRKAWAEAAGGATPVAAAPADDPAPADGSADGPDAPQGDVP